MNTDDTRKTEYSINSIPDEADIVHININDDDNLYQEQHIDFEDLQAEDELDSDSAAVSPDENPDEVPIDADYVDDETKAFIGKKKKRAKKKLDMARKNKASHDAARDENIHDGISSHTVNLSDNQASKDIPDFSGSSISSDSNSNENRQDGVITPANNENFEDKQSGQSQRIQTGSTKDSSKDRQEEQDNHHRNKTDIEREVKQVSNLAIKFIADGIKGDYSRDGRVMTALSAELLLSAGTDAAYKIMKHKQAKIDDAIETMHKINAVDPEFNYDSVNETNRADKVRHLKENGIKESEINNLLKYKDIAVNEYAFRKQVIENLYINPKFLSGSEEFKKHLTEKGFSNLSAASQLKLVDELKKYSDSDEAKKTDFTDTSKRELEKRYAVIKQQEEKHTVSNSTQQEDTHEKSTVLNRSISSGLNNHSEKVLFEKAIRVKNLQAVEMFKRKHGVSRAMTMFATRIRGARQDLFTTSVAHSFKSVQTGFNKARLTVKGAAFTVSSTVFAGQVLKRAFTARETFFERVKAKDFKKIESPVSLKKLRERKISPANAISKIRVIKAANASVQSSVMMSRSEQDEKEKKEKKDALVNRIANTKSNAGRIKKKIANKASDSAKMKNTAGAPFKRASAKDAAKKGIERVSKDAGKKAAEKTTKAAAKKTAEKGAKTVANATAKTAVETVKSSGIIKAITSALAAIPVPVWIAIGIILILFIFILVARNYYHAFIGSMQEISVQSEESFKEFTDGLTPAFTDVIDEMQQSVILVNAKDYSFDDEYMDIIGYLKVVQDLDTKREEDAISFANAPVYTYNPKDKGLSERQINGKYGQDADILSGHKTKYYGSTDRSNAYTLHYLDAYGNEIANHSTNAQDILSICAVMYANQFDKKKAFPILIEDMWYLMSPDIKWQESDIYCCMRNNCEVIGDTAYYLLCGDRYDQNGSLEFYYCNKYEDAAKIQHYKADGVKVTGEIMPYSYNGCKTRLLDKYMCIPVDKRYFSGTGVTFSQSDYDLYDAYVDGWIDYDEYLDIWHDCNNDDSLDVSYMDTTFYKEEHYCLGHFVACCFGHKDIDLYITVYDMDYAFTKNIYPTATTSHTGKYDKYAGYLELFIEDDAWNNPANIKWADMIFQNDWYEMYGVSVLGGVGFHIGNTLTDADIESILGRISEENLTVIQQAIIEFALSYVGRIPYYFGGKAESLDYYENHFGTTVSPDSKGRTRKGLDCSGFVQWVFANKGIKVPGSTAGFSGYSATRDHSSLKVGDLGFVSLPGAKSNHIGIYAGVDENGNDLWIHCNAGSGNVSVNNYNGFRYYVSLGSF